MTRRGALAALGGLAAACTRRSPAPSPEIDVALSNEHVGHRLRDGLKLDPPAWEETGVVIVGAGVAGLAAARALRRRGYTDFVVLELDAEPGGTSRGGRTDISPHPWGAHYTNVPRAENVELVRFLGDHGALDGVDENGEPRGAEGTLCRDPEERCFYGGRWSEGLLPEAALTVEAARDLARLEAEVARLGALRDARGRRAFTLPRALGSDDAELTALDRLSFAEWLDAHDIRAAPVRWLCDYACRDDFGAHPEHVSAWAGLHYFASRHRPDPERTAPTLTWPEGNARLVTWLLSDAEATVRTGTAVADVHPTGDGVELRALVDGERAVGFRAKRVILALPQGFAGRLLRPWRDEPPPHLREFVYGPWLVANLELHTRPGARGFPLAWDSVPYGGRGLGYICATHQTGLDWGPTVLTWYEALADPDAGAARRALLSWDAAACRDRVLAELSTAHPDLAKRLIRMRFARHGHAMIRPRPGFLWGPHLAAAARPYRGVHFAHTDLSGLALFEEAFFHGGRAAAEVLESLTWPG